MGRSLGRFGEPCVEADTASASGIRMGSNSSRTLRRVEQMEDDVVAGGDLSDAATMIAEERPHGVPVLRGRTEHEATRCFVDKRSERVESVERHHHRHAESRCDRHLADGNRKAALTAIVGCGDLAVADRSVDRPVARQWIIERGGHPSGAEIEKIRRKRAAERAFVRADQPEVVTDLHPSRIDRSTQVGHEASAEISKVPGIASPSNSLNSESLPEMNGIR